jgi:hypothetical protein
MEYKKKYKKLICNLMWYFIVHVFFFFSSSARVNIFFFWFIEGVCFIVNGDIFDGFSWEDAVDGFEGFGSVR